MCYQQLFDYFANEHDLTLLDADLQKIVNIVNNIKPNGQHKLTDNEVAALLFKSIEYLYKVSEKQIKSKTRERPIVTYRQIFSYLMRKHTGITLVKLGKILGRDYTTILSHLNMIENYKATGDTFYTHLINIENLFYEQTQKFKDMTKRRQWGDEGPESEEELLTQKNRVFF